MKIISEYVLTVEILKDGKLLHNFLFEEDTYKNKVEFLDECIGHIKALTGISDFSDYSIKAIFKS